MLNFLIKSAAASPFRLKKRLFTHYKYKHKLVWHYQNGV